jgi:hypothetical protein
MGDWPRLLAEGAVEGNLSTLPSPVPKGWEKGKGLEGQCPACFFFLARLAIMFSNSTRAEKPMAA